LTAVLWRSKPEFSWQIGVRFESIEIRGVDVPLNAILELPHPKVLTGTFASPLVMAPAKPADPSLGGMFSFRQQRLHLKNLDAHWVTAKSP
jgi:hypothetical protein